MGQTETSILRPNLRSIRRTCDIQIGGRWGGLGGTGLHVRNGWRKTAGHCPEWKPTTVIYLSIFTGLLIYEHYTRECEFGNFDKIKNKKHKKNKTTQKNTKTFG